MPAVTITLEWSRLERLLRGGVAVPQRDAVFAIDGPGALDCLQGLLSNDLSAPGANRLVYGAMLTPKGMIVADMWAVRRSDDFLLVAPRNAREPLTNLLTRSLPPRLAKVEARSEDWSTLRVYGEHAEAALAESRLIHAGMEAETVVETGVLGAPVTIAAGSSTSPFRFLIAGPHDTVEQVAALLADNGVTGGDADDYHAARILFGWPELGLEIGDKTLPQEARFEAIGGVSYTKGCFTGQETVARVHFRGRTQKELRGLDWSDLQPLSGSEVRRADRQLGEVHSILALPDRRIGMATIRREAEVGDVVLAGGREATIVPLPFDLPEQAA